MIIHLKSSIGLCQKSAKNRKPSRHIYFKWHRAVDMNMCQLQQLIYVMTYVLQKMEEISTPLSHLTNYNIQFTSCRYILLKQANKRTWIVAFVSNFMYLRAMVRENWGFHGKWGSTEFDQLALFVALPLLTCIPKGFLNILNGSHRNQTS